MNNEISEPIEDDDIDIDNGDCKRYGTSGGSEVKDGEDSEPADEEQNEEEEQRSHTVGELLAMVDVLSPLLAICSSRKALFERRSNLNIMLYKSLLK